MGCHPFGAALSVRILKRDELPADGFARELVGADHGGTGICAIFVDAPPGGGPDLHKHPYEEVFIVLEGTAAFVAGDERAEVHGGDIVIVPPDTPHAFTNTGDGQLRQIDIHVNPTFVTEWL